jgi:3'(2'), 5'-bisphosphate nucleotidase
MLGFHEFWSDPLDGTKEFVDGHVEAVTVLIGIARSGKAVAGTVVQPFGKKLVVWGAVGVGAFGYAREEPPADRRLILSTRSHESKEIEDLVERCKPTGVRPLPRT